VKYLLNLVRNGGVTDPVMIECFFEGEGWQVRPLSE